MSVISDALLAGNGTDVVANAVEKFVSSPQEHTDLLIEEDKAAQDNQYRFAQLDQQRDLAQIEINKIEAANPDWFVAGWRPAIGWVCAAGLGYQFLLDPLLLWLFPGHTPVTLDASQLYSLTAGMLGIAGMRSFDKLKGRETRHVGGNTRRNSVTVKQTTQ